MATDVSLDGKTLVGVANDEVGAVSEETLFHFEQVDERVHARYSGGEIQEGHLLGTIDGSRLDARYVQIHDDGETATGHTLGTVTVLDDGRVRIEDEWEWESRAGAGESVLEEIEG